MPLPLDYCPPENSIVDLKSKFRRAVLLNLFLDGLLILIASAILDGGMILIIEFVLSLCYWVFVAIIWIRGPMHISAWELSIVRWGMPVLFLISVAVFALLVVF